MRFGLGVLAVVAGFALPGVASAAELTVTRFDDTTSCTPGDCSLRGAIIVANGNGETDTITLAAGRYVLSITPPAGFFDPAGGELKVASGELTIRGAGARATTIDASGVEDAAGNPIARAGVLRINPARTPPVVTIEDVTITGGDPEESGGGIDNRGVLTLRRVAVVGNEAVGEDGGGIDNNEQLTIEDSLVANNRAGEGGGGIEQDDRMVMTNTTLSGNTSGPGDGGGAIDNDGDNAPGTDSIGSTTIVNSTIVGNTITGDDGGGIASQTGPSFFAPLTVRNTIIAGNSADTGAEDCTGASVHTSQGGNVGPATQCGFTAPGDRDASDPKLAALANTGGPTDTMAPLAGSPAIDAGLSCPPPAADQRGVARPIGAACESGAHEFAPSQEPVATPTQTPTPTPSANPTPTPTPTPSAKPSPLPTLAQVVTLPSTRRCVSRRKFRVRIRQLRGLVYRSASVFVNGRRVRVVRGRRLTAPVDLRGLPAGRFSVKIRITLADGRTISGTRRYRTCARKRRGGRPPL